MKNYVLKCAYDGTSYLGWQKTPLGPSLEGMLQQALEQIVQHPVILQAASRTDRGVHAHGQVVNFFSTYSRPLPLLHQSLNALLPPSIAILSLEHATDIFHPTLDAKGKEYIYRIDTSAVPLPFTRTTHWHLPCPCDWERAQQAANAFVGTHDFSALCNRREGKEYAHKIRTLWWCTLEKRAPQELIWRIAGDHFLYKMARNLIGTLVGIAQGKISSSVPALLQQKMRCAAGVCAPAHGLSLNQVFYKDIIPYTPSL